jgi:hypothetical protein
MEILGVDFSGAQTDNNTWLAQGLLEAGGLTLHSCRAVCRAELTEILSSLAGPAVAALDFPFSVPLEFSRYWQPEAASMPQLWAAAADMSPDQFMQMRDKFMAMWNTFVPRRREPKRHCDTYHPESFSCLRRVNPNMVPMTFQGMRMLDKLWASGCAVPPLEPQYAGNPVMLEAMPGAALKALGLPYKGYKNGRRAQELRQQILGELPARSYVHVCNLEEFAAQCLASHDCLDAVVAAVVAALWARDPCVFRHPPVGDQGQPDPTALIEGWLYAPVFLVRHSGLDPESRLPGGGFPLSRE